MSTFPVNSLKWSSNFRRNRSKEQSQSRGRVRVTDVRTKHELFVRTNETVRYTVGIHRAGIHCCLKQKNKYMRVKRFKPPTGWKQPFRLYLIISHVLFRLCLLGKRLQWFFSTLRLRRYTLLSWKEPQRLNFTSLTLLTNTVRDSSTFRLLPWFRSSVLLKSCALNRANSILYLQPSLGTVYLWYFLS